MPRQGGTTQEAERKGEMKRLRWKSTAFQATLDVQLFTIKRGMTVGYFELQRRGVHGVETYFCKGLAAAKRKAEEIAAEIEEHEPVAMEVTP
jgi:hypothetical protein